MCVCFEFSKNELNTDGIFREKDSKGNVLTFYSNYVLVSHALEFPTVTLSYCRLCRTNQQNTLNANELYRYDSVASAYRDTKTTQG